MGGPAPIPAQVGKLPRFLSLEVPPSSSCTSGPADDDSQPSRAEDPRGGPFARQPTSIYSRCTLRTGISSLTQFLQLVVSTCIFGNRLAHTQERRNAYRKHCGNTTFQSLAHPCRLVTHDSTRSQSQRGTPDRRCERSSRAGRSNASRRGPSAPIRTGRPLPCARARTPPATE